MRRTCSACSDVLKGKIKLQRSAMGGVGKHTNPQNSGNSENVALQILLEVVKAHGSKLHLAHSPQAFQNPPEGFQDGLSPLNLSVKNST